MCSLWATFFVFTEPTDRHKANIRISVSVPVLWSYLQKPDPLSYLPRYQGLRYYKSPRLIKTSNFGSQGFIYPGIFLCLKFQAQSNIILIY